MRFEIDFGFRFDLVICMIFDGLIKKYKISKLGTEIATIKMIFVPVESPEKAVVVPETSASSESGGKVSSFFPVEICMVA